MATAEQVFKQIEKRLTNAIKDLPIIVGEEAVNFSIDAFEQESWSGNSQEVWEKRKTPNAWGQVDKNPDRNLLVKTGKLKKSVRIGRIGTDTVSIFIGGSGIPYARAHLFGFRGKVTQNVEPFTRKIKGKEQQVKGFTRTINQNIPQRRFAGGFSDSPYLYQRAKRACISHLTKTIKTK